MGEERSGAYLKRALSSAKPAASASTAASFPMLRSPNMALYRSKRGSVLSSSFRCRSCIVSGLAVGAGLLPSEMMPDVGGAGSTDVYVLVRGLCQTRETDIVKNVSK